MKNKKQANRPSVLYRPKLEKGFVLWYARYGDMMGCGGSPERAMESFDRKWLEELPMPDKIETEEPIPDTVDRNKEAELIEEVT